MLRKKSNRILFVPGTWDHATYMSIYREGLWVFLAWK